MKCHRRAFLQTGAFALLGGVLAPAAPGGVVARALGLSAQERAIADWLGGFSRRVQLTGGAVYERLQGRMPRRAKWQAEVGDFDRLARGLGKPPGAKGVFTNGSTVCFLSGDCEVVVENLTSATYRQREELRCRGLATFAHETLAYDPLRGELSDPAGAADAAELQVIQRGDNFAEAFDTVLRGLVESRRLGLAPGAEFERLQAGVLSCGAPPMSIAGPITRALLGRIATWAGIAPADEVARVIGSPLVAGSVRLTLGPDALAPARDAFAAGNPAAAWLAALLGPRGIHEHGLRLGLARLGTEEHFDRLRSRAALAEARALLG